MSIETVRISPQGREQLIRLKRYTGIANWNILCRWGFCVSLAEKTRPPVTNLKGEGVEMSWRTFGGAEADLYYAMLKARCIDDGIELTEANLAEQFRLHLHRGLGYLSSNKKTRSIEEFVRQIL